jgi:outer membrane autotransporter protein
MKKVSVVLAIAAFVALSGSAYAAVNPYVGISGGAMLSDDNKLNGSTGESSHVSLKTGYSVNGVFGISVPVTSDCSIRPEVEFGYKAADVDEFKFQGLKSDLKGDTSVLSGMVNVYFDINTGTAVTPYVGGGLGVANVNVSNVNFASGVPVLNKSDDTVFAYQGGVGAKFSASKHVSLDLGYRYFVSDEVRLGSYKSDFQSHNIQAGIQYQF